MHDKVHHIRHECIDVGDGGEEPMCKFDARAAKSTQSEGLIIVGGMCGTVHTQNFQY